MKIGAARVQVRWPVGLPMAGYARRVESASGYHQPLHVSALVASDDHDRASCCLIVAEILAVDKALTATVRHEVARSLGLPTDAILLAATHTHAAPAGLSRFPALSGAESFLGEYAPDRVETLVAACLQAVGQAQTMQAPAVLETGVAEVTRVAANRRTPDGLFDPAAPFVLFRSLAGNLIGAVFSYACHPTVLDASNQLYSGDLSGVATAILSEHWSCPVIGLTGAAGDISTRFTRAAATVSEVERLGQSLAAAILRAPLVLDDLHVVAYRVVSVELHLKPLPNQEQARATLDSAVQRLRATKNAAHRRVIEAEIEGLQVALSVQERPATLTTEVQILQLGRTLIIGFPGEMFVSYGLEISSTLASRHVLIAGYANDYVGYVPTPDITAGYEANVAIVTSDAGTGLIQAAINAVSPLRPG